MRVRFSYPLGVHKNLTDEINPLDRCVKLLFLLLGGLATAALLQAASTDTLTDALASSSSPVAVSTVAVSTLSVTDVAAPKPVRAIHVTAWMAGSKKYRPHLNDLLRTTVINAVVIDIKEYEGEVYIPGVSMAEKAGAYVPAMPDIANWVADLKHQGVYTVARIVVFKDNIMPRKSKALAVKNPQGDLWLDRHNITWLDPYNPEAGRYNLLIALQAAKLGFDEVQFDYIRFPTDGSLSQMRFSQPYSKVAASRALVAFLKQAHQLLEPLGTKISIDVFGLTTSVTSGMGIGQVLGPMAEQVDFVCPMVYPSHYAKGEYGIPNPNDQPYRVIHLAMRDALKILGPADAKKLRPYLQDFSLPHRGIRYHAKEVRAQMQAAMDVGVESWTLWNARCSYTLDAIRTPVVAASSTTVQMPASVDVGTTPK
jgi:hypothetical protein